jgi:hypothetical protein
MYNDGYGYRSSLNSSMARHLQQLADRFSCRLSPEGIALDIGSNDGTLLKAYPKAARDSRARRIGYDPIHKFASHYDEQTFMPEYFSADSFLELTQGARAEVVTSIAMFYDVPDPTRFAKDVAAVLTDDGVWHTEQAYLGHMLTNCAYDAICQEHLSYYGLAQIASIAAAAELQIIDLEFNDVNGGSIGVTMAKQGKRHRNLATVLEAEDNLDFAAFVRRVHEHPRKLRTILSDCDKVAGFGASTKGNILLQHCALGPREIIAVADVNRDKWGKVTATGIPILSDENVETMEPSHYLVLPWHFRENILKRYKGTGRKFIFPLPVLEVVNA